MSARPRWKKVAIGCASGALILVAGIGGLVRAMTYNPADVVKVRPQGEGDTVSLAPGATVTVMVWNIQYCATRKYHFFYDGGEAVHVTEEDVREALASIAAAIERHDPDILLFQEFDRTSDRTARIDQVEELMAACPYPRYTTAPYHRVGYVPHPPHQHLGRVDMNLGTFSRFDIERAERVQLPLLDEPFYRRAFNLKRAVLVSRIARADGATPLVTLNTHLSAFSYGDGTLEAQVRVIEDQLRALDEEGAPWILGGDFNLLPPGDEPGRLVKDAELYDAQNNAIEVLHLGGRRPAIDWSVLQVADPPVFTYQPFGADGPDRTLDYLFVSEGIEVIEARVLSEHGDVSDHLPLLVTLRVP